MVSPMAVPRSTRVSSSLSSRESMTCSSSQRPGCGRSIPPLQFRPMRLLLALVTLATLTAGCRESVEARFIYYPSHRLHADPSSVGLAFRDVRFTAADGVRLHGWLIPGRTATTLL